MTKYINLENQTFGKLTAIDSIKVGRKTLWRFQCECGSFVQYPAARVANGHIKSCGCSSKYSGEKSVAFEIFTRNYSDGNLDFDKFCEMILKDCYYCGKAPCNSYNRKDYKTKQITCNLVYNGLDRLDSSLPHNIDNVVPCCWKCNKLKSNTHVKDFLEHIQAIYKHRIAN